MADKTDSGPDPSVAVLCGGVGAARFLSGLIEVVEPSSVTAVVNVADDVTLHGLRISPDIDTIVYTLAGAHSVERGWGLDGETWQAMEMLGRYGGRDWFSLGDRDLGTHLFRTDELNKGRTLTEVTAAIARAWELEFTILPVTNDRLRTMITTVDEGEIGFQEYFVRRRHDVAVTAVRFDGAAAARPAPGVLEALSTSDVVVIAPSNPVVSIDPILAVPGVRAALEARSDSVVAISPIVGGKALKGPADRLLVELGRQASVEAVGQWYADIASILIIDDVDADRAEKLEGQGMNVMVTDTIMARPGVAASLARSAIDAVIGR
ncbi:MAG: 2-phospho-L-lactate transferase [Acidimicrobiia bacterium]|nr:2-phospho-L-lactate transferase [Acidimicrobiia bacterium]